MRANLTPVRCPHCAAEIEDGSSFCGVCGRRTLAVPAQKPPPPEPGTSLASSSVFELPVNPGARALRVALVLALDVVLAGSGVAMAASWWKSRERATPVVATTPDGTPVKVELAPPSDAARLATGPRPDARASGTGTPAVRPDAGGGTTTNVPPPKPVDGGGGFNPFPRPDATPVVVPPRPPDAAPVVVPPGPPDAAPVVTPPASVDGAIVATDEFADKVQAVVQGNMTQIKRCYERAAKQGTNSQPLEGKIVVNASVTTSGAAANVVVVENTTGSEELQACVQALVQSWSFPPAPEETDFVWPFVFKAPR